MDNADFYPDIKKLFDDPSKITAAGNDEIRAILEEALATNKNSPTLLGVLSYVYVREAQNGWGNALKRSRAASLAWAEKFAEDAFRMAPDDYVGVWFRGITRWNLGNFEDSLSDYKTARKLNPHEPDIPADMGEALIFSGQAQEAIDVITEAIGMAKGKVPHWYFWNLGRANYAATYYDEALAAIDRIMKESNVRAPANDTLLVTAAAKAQLGDQEGAAADIAAFSKNSPHWTLAHSAEYQYGNPDDRDNWLKGLKLAGLT
jgi:adenylate cyclase